MRWLRQAGRNRDQARAAQAKRLFVPLDRLRSRAMACHADTMNAQ
jgi:hypothetical protein